MSKWVWIGLLVLVVAAGGAGGFWYLGGNDVETQPTTLQFGDVGTESTRSVNGPAPTTTTTAPATTTIPPTTIDDEEFVQVWTVRAPVTEGALLADARSRLRLAIRTIPAADAPRSAVEDLTPRGQILSAARDLTPGDVLTTAMVTAREDEPIAVWVATVTIEPLGDRFSDALADDRLQREDRFESELPAGFLRADSEPPATVGEAGEPVEYEFIRTMRADSALTWSHLAAVRLDVAADGVEPPAEGDG